MNVKGDPEVADSTGNNVPVGRAHSEGKVRWVKALGILFRLAAAPLLAIALALMVTDKQTKTIVIPVTPPITLSKTAKYSGTKALVFYVYATGIAAGYVFLHALYSILTFRKSGFGSSRFRRALSYLFDQLMLYLVIAAAAATTEVAYLAKNGNSASSWGEICSAVGKFCDKVGLSLIFCFLGILNLIALSAVSAYQLFSHAGSSGSSAAQRHAGGRTGNTMSAPRGNYGRT